MNITAFLEGLEKQEEFLAYEEFHNEDALILGTKLANEVKDSPKPVAIRIYLGDIIVFQYSMEGKEEYHYEWIRRKRNVLLKTGHSSMYARVQLQYLHMYEDMADNASEYGFGCGAFPIRQKGKGIIGTVAMSGLPDPKDHKVIVETIAKIQNKKLPDSSYDLIDWKVPPKDS